MPLIAAWFTLRKGYSIFSRVEAFSWMMIFMLLLVSGVELLYFSNSTQPQQSLNQYNDVLIERLLSDYAENEIKADQKYRNGYFRVTGFVNRVRRDGNGEAEVMLGANQSILSSRMLRAVFHSSQEGKVADLKTGEQITVICRINGIAAISVLGSNCYFY
jgi:hypothetical protein